MLKKWYTGFFRPALEKFYSGDRKMISVTYVSQATHEFTENELIELLARSRANNSKKNITGMLIYHNRTFVQILEGDEDAVDNLFEVISEDSRHTGVATLKRETVEKRRFGKWSMGFKRLTDNDLEKIEGLNDQPLIQQILANQEIISSFLLSLGIL